MKLKPAGMALGLGGNVALGWGLYHLLGIGSCGGDLPPCPGEATPYFIALPLGIIASVIGGFLGGGVFAFGGTFAAVGIASVLRGFNGGAGPEGDTTFPFVFGAFFLLPSLLPVLLIPYGRRKLREQQRFAQEADPAVATVLDVTDTGVTINENPRVRLRLRVEPEDRSPAFEVETVQIVSRVDVPRAGDRYTAYHVGQEVQLGREIERPAPDAPAATVEQGWVTELGRLNDLRLQGALTDDEFARAKDRLLNP